MRGREIKRKKERSDSEAKYLQLLGSIIATIATVPSLAKKVGILADANKACSNRENKKNKYYNSKPTAAAGRVHAKM